MDKLLRMLNRYIHFSCAILVILNLNFAWSFERQNGQLKDQHANVNHNVLFSTQSNGLFIFLTKQGFSYQLIKPLNERDKQLRVSDSSIDSISYEFNRVDIDFIGHNLDFHIETYEADCARNYYYSGNNKSLLKKYSRVVFRNVYDHIDFEFTDYDGVFKYNIIVHPGGNISDINLNYSGECNIDISDKEVIIHTPLKQIIDYIPKSFILNKSKKEAQVVFVKESLGVGYKLEGSILAPTDTLIIDPMPHLFFGTYIGGGSDEYANEITIDEAGYTYVTGHTQSLNNIATVGAHQGTFTAVFDVFVAKFSPEGNRIWGTYIGGSSFDRAYGIDYNNGHLYIVGSTLSPDFSTVGAYQEFTIDNDDAFIAKFDTTGTRLWCTYYGGDSHDFAAAVVTDSDENIYITGHSASDFNIATVGAHDEVHTGVMAAFLAKFNSNGFLEWGTYYGDAFEEGWGIALDSDENPIFSGFTTSSNSIASVGAHQQNLGGGVDAFLTKFNQNGVWQWGTYYGGSNDDYGYEIDCDSQDNIYFVGGTGSVNNIYFNSGFQSTPTSIDDGFVCKFDNNGNIIWGTYIGGNEADYLYGVRNYLDNGVLITGLTQSSENIATLGAYQSSLSGQYDALVMKLSPNGNLEWGSYFGGPLSDEGRGIAFNPSNAYFTIAGYTLSNSGVSSSGAFQENFGGGFFDAFIAKFCAPIFPALEYNFSGDLCSDNEQILSITAPSLFNQLEWNTGSTDPSIDLSLLPVGAYTFYVNSLDTNNCPAYSDTLQFQKFESTPLDIQQNQLTFCEGDDLLLWSEDLFESYIWSTNSTDTLTEIQDLSTGSITINLQATNINGCISYDTVEIVVNPSPSPEINVQGSANFCQGETIDVGVFGSYDSYVWHNGMTTPFITLLEQDTVWVFVENQFGCGGYSDSLFINSDVLTPEVVVLTSLPFCEDSMVLFGLNNNYNDYLWMNGDTTATVLLDLGVGTHYVYVDVANLCGGTAQSDSLEIIIHPTTQANIQITGSSEFCIGEEYTLSVDGEFDFVQWQNEIFSNSFGFSPSSPGDYTFVVETIDSNGCPSFDTLVVVFEDCQLNVIENVLDNSWSVHPNPGSEKVYLSIDEARPINIIVFDAQGKKVKSLNLSNGDYIDVSKLSKGVYTLFPEKMYDKYLPIRIVVQ
jgi:hypothetical protein